MNGTEIRSLRGRDPFAGQPLSGQYDWNYRRHDAERWAEHYGIPFREPPTRQLDLELLVRAAAARCGRHSIGCEVDTHYFGMAERRIRDETTGLFSAVEIQVHKGSA